MSDSNFVDYVKIMCRSGHGGAGSAHLLRTRLTAKGGPDGGDGGRGGSPAHDCCRRTPGYCAHRGEPQGEAEHQRWRVRWQLSHTRAGEQRGRR